MSKYNVSPLRYPGAKSVLSETMAQIVSYNSYYNVFVEPYFGGGSVGLYLLLNGYVNKLVINDLDPDLFYFWQSVLYRTDELVTLIEQVPLNVNTWKGIKEVFEQHDTNYGLFLGFATLYLNRTCRNGILNAGIIGGYEQKGNYKMDCRFNKAQIIWKIRDIAAQKDHIELFSRDGAELIHDLTLDENSMIYCDPPYFEKGNTLYQIFFTKEDHEALKDTLKETKSNWVLSYDDTPIVRDWYKDYTIRELNWKYGTTNGKKGNELLILSKNINLSYIKL